MVVPVSVIVVLLFEAKKVSGLNITKCLNIGWHKFAFATVRLINYPNLKIFPIYFVRSTKQIFLFVFPQFKFHEKGVILNDTQQMTPVTAFVVNL